MTNISSRSILFIMRFKLMLIFLSAFLIRLAMNIIFQGLDAPPDPDMGADHVEYDLMAQSLARGEGFSLNGSGPTTYRPPGTSFLLFPIYYFFGVNYTLARLMFCLLSAATCVVVYYIGKKLLNEKMGLVAALMLSVYPLHFYYSMHFYSEVPWAFFVSLAVWLALQFEETSKIWWGILSGIFIGIAAYIRPLAFFYLIFYSFLCLCNFLAVDKTKCLKLIVIPLTAAVLVIAPWIIRNYRVTGHFVFISTIGGTTFWGGNNETIFRDPNLMGSWIPCNQLPEHADYNKIKNLYKRDKAAYKYGFDFIKHHLKDLPKLEMMKLYRLLTPVFGTSNRLFNAVGGISWAVLSIFVVIGIIRTFKNIKFISLHGMLLMTLFIALTFYGDHRFREAVAPFLVLYASAGVLYILRKLKMGRY